MKFKMAKNSLFAGPNNVAYGAAKADQAVRFVVLDAAVMIEAGWDKVCDLLVHVDAPDAVRRSRVARQRGWSAADLELREQAQMAVTEKAARADVTIDNSGPPEDLEPQLDRLMERLGIENASWKRR